MNKQELLLLLPEVIMIGMACIILLLGLLTQHKKNLLPYYLSIVTLVAAACSVFNIACSNYNQGKIYLLNNSLLIDNFAIVFKLVLCFLLITSIIYAREYNKSKDLITGEFYALILFSTAGNMVLFSSINFLTVYLGLELLVLPIYALLALYKANLTINNKSIEAAIKYFIMGILGSCLLLYGVSLLYGLTGGLDFNSTLSLEYPNKMALYFATVFIIAGIGFKLGVVPFQMWVPDVYEGAITSLTLFIGVIAKIGAFALSFRVFSLVLTGFNTKWQLLLTIIALASIVLGSVVGLVQTNVKRMLAYSAIAQFGFITLGLSVANQSGSVGVIFYTMGYIITLLGTMGILLVLSYRGFEAEVIKDFKGLALNSPILAVLMALFMLSMIGMPPTIGFYGKFLIIKNLIDLGYNWTAIIALIFSVVSAFYYLRIIKIMFFVNQNEEQFFNYQEILHAWPGKTLLLMNGLAIIGLGVFPGGLLYLCQQMVS